MKKSLLIVLTAVCVLSAALGIRAAKKSNLFKSYPDEEFLSIDEAALRPAYNLLSPKEKAVYTALLRGISEQNTIISLPFEIDGDTYTKVYCILEKQEGRLFYLDSTFYTAMKIRDAEMIFRGEAPFDDKIEELEAAEVKALNGISSVSNDYEKALYIHDYLIKNCNYVTGDDREFSSTAYGCLVEGKANCEGYAKAFDLLAADLKLESVLVTGTTNNGENHAWNQVRINGNWYNLDATWADTDVDGDIRRVYFLCDDDDFLRTHFPDNAYFEPFECNSTEQSYYVRNDLFVSSDSDADRILRREISAGSNAIELKFADKGSYDSFKKHFIDNQAVFDILIEMNRSTDTYLSISLRENEEELCLKLFLN